MGTDDKNQNSFFAGVYRRTAGAKMQKSIMESTTIELYTHEYHGKEVACHQLTVRTKRDSTDRTRLDEGKTMHKQDGKEMSPQEMKENLDFVSIGDIRSDDCE